MPASKSPLIKITAYFIFSLFFLAVIVLVMETVFRFMPVYNREWMDYNKHTIWRIKANNSGKHWTQDHADFYQVCNREGFNDINHSYEKRNGVKRIMILGDSYTGGYDYPIPETFCGVVQSLLNGHGKGEYEVMNCATPAWSTEQQYSYFIHEGIKYKPDYVLMVVAPNDIRETFTRHILQIEGDSVSPWLRYPMLKSEKLTWRLCVHSSFAQWMRKNKMLPNAVCDEMFWKYFCCGFTDVDTIYGWEEPLFFKEAPGSVQQANARFSTLLSALDKRCAEANAKLLVSIIPTKQEFDGSLSDTSKYEPGKVCRWLADECEKKEIPFCPTFNEARNLPKSLDLYQYWEWHLNPEGHKFMGNVLSKFLEKETATAN